MENNEEKEPDLTPAPPKESAEIKFKNERASWSAKIITMSESIRNIHNVTGTLVDLHSERQRALEYMYDLFRIITKINSKLSIERSRMLQELTDTTKLDSFSYRYTDKERDKIIEARLDELKTKLSFVTNHADFLKESIKTIDNLIWNLRYRIELENLRT